MHGKIPSFETALKSKISYNRHRLEALLVHDVLFLWGFVEISGRYNPGHWLKQHFVISGGYTDHVRN